MTQYTIDAVGSVKDLPDGKYGPMRVYKLTLGSPNGQQDAEWMRKATAPAPHVGQSVEGTLEEGQYGLRFKAAPQGPGGGGPRPEDPAKARAIQRMSSQDRAIQIVRTAMEFAIVTERPADIPELLKLVARTADWLDADVDRARAKQ